MPTRAWRVAFVSSHFKWMLVIAGLLGFASVWMDRADVTYWPMATSSATFKVHNLIALACLGFAAWQARTERQPSIAELATTFPTGRSRQLAIGWSIVVAWGLVAYLGTMLVSIGVLALDAYWGYPDVPALVHGAAAIVLASTVGYALGWIFPTYLLIPVWVVGWFVLDGMLALRDSSARWVVPRSAFQNVERSLFRESVPPQLDLKQTAWFIAASVFILSLCFLGVERRRRTIAAAGLASVPVIVTLGMLLSIPPDVPYGSGPARDFEPVCRSTDVVTVCLHPAERPLLNEVVGRLTRSLEPVAGLPDVPALFVDSAVQGSRPGLAGIHVFDEDQLDQDVAIALFNVLIPTWPETQSITLTTEQAIVLTWLYAQSGYAPETAPYWQFTSAAQLMPRERVQMEIVAKASALGQLTSTSQQSWVARHWVAIRGGTLEAAALP